MSVAELGGQHRLYTPFIDNGNVCYAVSSVNQCVYMTAVNVGGSRFVEHRFLSPCREFWNVIRGFVKGVALSRPLFILEAKCSQR